MTKAKTDFSVLLLVDSTPDAVRASETTGIPWSILHVDERLDANTRDATILPAWLVLLGDRDAVLPPVWIGYGDVDQLQPVLDRGGADFLVSPWSAEEAYARTVAAFRRSKRYPVPVLRGRRLQVGENALDLSPSEARVLAILLERRNCIVPRDLLKSTARVRSLDVCISKLRHTLKPFLRDNELNWEIHTEYGIGYEFRSSTDVDKLWKTRPFRVPSEERPERNAKKVQRNVVSMADNIP